jgi:NAD dependent epimerase/dehydratase family enzyme
MYVFALENNTLEGVFNAVAPGPVSNKELVLKIAVKLRDKTFIPLHIPSLVLKIILGEMSTEILKSTTVNSDKIRNIGFRFLYPSIDAALAAL